MTAASAPRPAAALDRLVDRFDSGVLPLSRRRERLRLQVNGGEAVDLVLSPDGSVARTPAQAGRSPVAVISADREIWDALAAGSDVGMDAFRRGRLTVRGNLHLGIGFLAATAPADRPGRLRFREIPTRAGALSVVDAGTGAPTVLIHGLGATKASFVPTVIALARSARTIAVDLPGFGDSVKPVGAAYDPRYFAGAIEALLDALEIDRAHIVGNSLGGRVALEVGARTPDRVDRLAMLAPSLAWLRKPRWAGWLRWARPELGLVQPAPRVIVDRLTRRVVPGATSGWAAAGVDEFLRSFATPRGRAAFYAAARNIVLEEPTGPNGFWTELANLRPPALFVWGRRDNVVPIAFARHVERVLPTAEHLELDCGHVPQLERPRETHAALRRFLDLPDEPGGEGGSATPLP